MNKSFDGRIIEREGYRSLEGTIYSHMYTNWVRALSL
jgi:hypothetical protein